MPRETGYGEREHYPSIERFLKKRFSCFVIAQDRGAKFV